MSVRLDLPFAEFADPGPVFEVLAHVRPKLRRVDPGL